jgi:hypothetical protein
VHSGTLYTKIEREREGDGRGVQKYGMCVGGGVDSFLIEKIYW